MQTPARIPPSFAGWFLLFAANNILLELLHYTYYDSWLLIAAIGMTSGVVGAQCILLAVWMTFGPWPLRQRLCFGWLAALLLVTILVAGSFIRTARYNPVVWGALALLVAALLVFHLAIQIPLWILRGSLGMRILAPQADHDSSSERRLSVRDLLIATTFIALGLATLRWMSFLQTGDYEEFLLQFAGILAVALPLGSCVCLTVLLTTLRARRVVAATIAASALYLSLLAVRMGAESGWFTRLRSANVAFNTAVFLGFTVTLHGLMLLARRQGYRFQMRR